MLTLILHNIFLLKPLVIVSLLFSFFMSIISAIISMKKFEFFHSHIVTKIINTKFIYNFSIFCLIFSRFFLNLKKIVFKVYLVFDFFILTTFLVIRIAPIFYPTIWDSFAIEYIFILSFFATMDLIVRGIVKFGFLVDNAKPFGIINFFEWQNVVGQVGRAFKNTVSHTIPKTPLSGGLPQAGKESGSHINDLNKIQLIIAGTSLVVGAVGVGAGIYYGYHNKIAAEASAEHDKIKAEFYRSETLKNNALTEYINDLRQSNLNQESSLNSNLSEVD